MIKISLLGLALAGAVSVQAFAADATVTDEGKGKGCSITIEGTDAMKYQYAGADVSDIKVPEACRSKEITFKLKHTGKLPATVMGHNLVIIEASKQAGVVAEGLKAGPTVGYAPTKADGMIAHTKTIGGGESTDLKVAKGSLKSGTNYGFVCTFAGHAGIMHGTLTFVK